MRKQEKRQKGQCPTHKNNSSLKIISLFKSFIIKKYPQKQIHICMCVYSCILILIIMQSCFKNLLKIPKLSAIAQQ